MFDSDEQLFAAERRHATLSERTIAHVAGQPIALPRERAQPDGNGWEASSGDLRCAGRLFARSPATRALAVLSLAPTDPAMLAAAGAGMAAVAIAAVLVPAWRASHIEPLQALRRE